MRFISWNVNGLRACVGKGFEDSFKAHDADFFCLTGDQDASRTNWICSLMAISRFGTMQTRKDIRAQPSIHASISR
jgi:hypothetical protein